MSICKCLMEFFHLSCIFHILNLHILLLKIHSEFLLICQLWMRQENFIPVAFFSPLFFFKLQLSSFFFFLGCANKAPICLFYCSSKYQLANGLLYHKFLKIIFNCQCFKHQLYLLHNAVGRTVMDCRPEQDLWK